MKPGFSRIDWIARSSPEESVQGAGDIITGLTADSSFAAGSRIQEMLDSCTS